jgi:hypothetical protein
MTEEAASVKEAPQTKAEAVEPAAAKPVIQITRKMLALVLAMVLAVNVAVSVCGVMVYDQYFAQKIAVLDVNKYIEDLKSQYVSGRVTDADLNNAPKKIKAAVDSVSKNTTIFIGEAVLQNAKQIQIKD